MSKASNTVLCLLVKHDKNYKSHHYESFPLCTCNFKI